MQIIKCNYLYNDGYLGRIDLSTFKWEEKHFAYILWLTANAGQPNSSVFCCKFTSFSKRKKLYKQTKLHKLKENVTQTTLNTILVK